MTKRALVTGAGGFIGHHFVKFLLAKGYWVRGVDIKKPEFEDSPANEFTLLDLRTLETCVKASKGVDEVYNLAADMGGIGFITAYHAEIARNNILINSHMLEASRINKVLRYFYSSSACIYPQRLQNQSEVTPLKEEDAYPADPEEGYGWEKLFAEKLCQYYYEDYDLETRVARFHNVYGTLGTFDGGREKVPAALCRKIALAPDGSEIEIWGDGEQTRSFTYIDDCVEGVYRIMQSDCHQPLNLGTERLITINELVDMVARIAGKTLSKRHDTSKPQGVRGRNSDNTLLRNTLNWEPLISLEEGMTHTYKWIEGELRKTNRIPMLSESTR
ncbi:MAG: NAD-dependent epimerase/dehydratase family protein [Chloroflexi bacterium]|nr:NAD-dependent epimerase/dehydratase family protein [Chloroflexota bacterium]